MAKSLGVSIDKNNPRESRLAVALRCDELGRVPEAIGAMSGIPLHEYDKEELGILSITRKRSDPKTFYNGFSSADK